MAQKSPRYRYNRLSGIPFYPSFNPKYLRFGDVYYVCSTYGADDTSNGRTPQEPFATIDYAIGQCTASNNDTIVVLAGHTESVTAAGTITCDVADVAIVGTGVGSNRPTITITTVATADIDITAANVIFDNLIIDETGVDSVNNGIHVAAASFTMRNCEVVGADGTGQADLWLLTTAAADKMLIEDCRFIGSDDAGAVAAIRLTGGDSITSRKNYIKGAFTNTLGGIDVDTTATTLVDIDNNYIINTTADSTVCINLIAACTGVVRNNKLATLTDGGFGQVDTPGNCVLYLNLGVNQYGEASRVIPVGTLSA